MRFFGKKVKLPLTQNRMWLDWDIAMSILGHELEIKTTYKTLTKNNSRPTLFFDIGSNYGTHSLLLLKHGIPTFSFEPNPACYEYFREICALNHVDCNLQAVALGEKSNEVEFVYPEHEAWLGKISRDTSESFNSDSEIRKIRVKQISLDSFVNSTGSRPTLIKIDTEGTELEVLKGPVTTLCTCRPVIIFESFKDSSRMKLFNFFRDNGYMVSFLPISRLSAIHCADYNEFAESSAANFLALPNSSHDCVSVI